MQLARVSLSPQFSGVQKISIAHYCFLFSVLSFFLEDKLYKSR